MILGFVLYSSVYLLMQTGLYEKARLEWNLINVTGKETSYGYYTNL